MGIWLWFRNSSLAWGLLVSATMPAPAAADAVVDHFLKELEEAEVSLERAAEAMQLLGDPRSRALLERWAASSNLEVRSQARVGLARLKDPARINAADLAAIANTQEAGDRSVLLTYGLFYGLLDEPTQRQLFSSELLDNVDRDALHRSAMRAGLELNDQAWLRKMLNGPDDRLAGRAAAILARRKDRAALDALQRMMQEAALADRPSREAMSALRWAESMPPVLAGGFGRVLAEAQGNPALSEEALAVAIRFGASRTETMWHEAFEAAEVPAFQRALVAAAMQWYPEVPASVIERIVNHDHAAFRRCGAWIQRIDLEPTQRDADWRSSLEATTLGLARDAPEILQDFWEICLEQERLDDDTISVMARSAWIATVSEQRETEANWRTMAVAESILMHWLIGEPTAPDQLADWQRDGLTDQRFWRRLAFHDLYDLGEGDEELSPLVARVLAACRHPTELSEYLAFWLLKSRQGEADLTEPPVTWLEFSEASLGSPLQTEMIWRLCVIEGEVAKPRTLVTDPENPR